MQGARDEEEDSTVPFSRVDGFLFHLAQVPLLSVRINCWMFKLNFDTNFR